MAQILENEFSGICAFFAPFFHLHQTYTPVSVRKGKCIPAIFLLEPKQHQRVDAPRHTDRLALRQKFIRQEVVYLRIC